MSGVCFHSGTSPTCPLRTDLATALPFCWPQSWKHWFSAPQDKKKKKIILFKLNARRKTRRNCALEKYTDMLSFAFKNTHTISECLEREVRGGEEEKERGSEGGKKGKGADFLILTQRALRHAISPNYEGSEGRCGRGE